MGDMNFIKNWNINKEEYKKLLEDGYNNYTIKISPKKMAASIECCIFLCCLFDFGLENVLDLGSGFSSYTFRKMKKYRDSKTKIFTVDTSSEWLSKTKEFCLENNLEEEVFIGWEDFEKINNKFDLIFFDIDYSDNRKKYLQAVFEKYFYEKTLVVCDDMHKSNLREAYYSFLKLKNYNIINIKDQTIDELGRYSLLVTR